MASVVEQQKDPAAKFGSLVDEQIAQTTGRIRIHDLMLGALCLAVMISVYATGMILLDKYLNLAEWVRQLALLGFLTVFGGVTYLYVVRPLRKRINPLYAAAQVEKTIDDAKNSVTGYVEAQEKGDVHLAVKAAMSARAARSLDDADVNRAVNHRSLLFAGGILIVFLLTLVVLFFVFRPSQFSSLIGRAFVPFSSDPIASRTQLTLLNPTPPDPTITARQTITVAVHVGGKVPAKDSPARVRVLLRYNSADPNYEELPMEQGETSRDWQLKVPEHLVQNGFWYKVAAGDTETPEYRVNVRSLPQFTDFEATYEYPAYTNKPNDRASDAHIRAYRGTRVTLVAKTNREVKEGLLKFDTPGLAPVTATPAAGKPDSLQFQFTITEPTRYQLFMTTTAGERNADSPWYTVSLDTDNAPTVQITKPAQVESESPANGQLAVDGAAWDDFGLDKVRLRMRVDGRDLTPVYFLGEKSLRREKDNTWPRDLRPDGFKLSADLTKLAFADGAKFEPQDKMVVEFWVEAIDNCSEAPAVEGWGDKPQRGNVGRSEVYKLNLTPPRTDDADKQNLDQRKDQRKDEEKQHNQQQQQKLDSEKRDTKPQQQDKKDGTDPNQQPKQGDKKDGTDQKQDSNQAGKGGSSKEDNPPKKGDMPPPKQEGKSEPKMGDGMGSGGMPDQKQDSKSDPKMGGMPDAKMPPDMPPKKDDPQQPMGGGMNNKGMGGGMDQAPPPKTPEEKKAEEDARRVQQELDKNKAEGGDAKPNPATRPEDRTEPAQQKPQPKMDAGQPQDSQPKEGPKPGDPGSQMPKGGDEGASQSKPAGNLEQHADPATPKPMPKEPGPKDTKPQEQPAEKRNEPLGGTPGTEKPEPKKDETQPKGGQNTDPMSGSAAKPAGDQKQGDPASKPKDPPADAGMPKPNPEPARGADKDPTQQKPGGPPPETRPKDDPNAGGAKPQQQPPNAEHKPPMDPKDPMGKQPDASEPKPEPKNEMNPMGGGASEPRSETPKPMGGSKDINRGEDKPQPKDQPQGGDPKLDQKDPKNGTGGKETQPKELTEQQKKELQDAARNLNNPDPEKRKAAQDKLDKTIGEDKRKEVEQLQQDLNSPDKGTRDAAQKKVDEMVKKGDDTKQGGEDGKKLSAEDIAKLQDQLKDLNSKDDNKRKEAEKNLDDKLGKEAREKLQEQMKNQPMMNDPKTDDEMKKKLDEMLKDQQGRGKGPIDPKQPHKGPGSSTEPVKDAMADDPRNRAKTAQLQLEEFEKHRYDNDLKEKLGWTQEKMDEFLKAQRERVDQLAKEADAHEQTLQNQPLLPPGPPTITGGSAGKVEGRVGVTGATGTSTGAAFAPPGFEDARKRFAEEAAKLKKKQ